MVKPIEQQIIEQIEEFSTSILMIEFEKELDNIEKEVVKSIKGAASVDDLHMCKGTLVSLDKLRNIFNVIRTKAQHRLSNKA